MTCALTIPCRCGAVVIAADTCASSGHDTAGTVRKIFRVGDSAIAGAGSVGDAQHTAAAWNGDLTTLAHLMRDRERPLELDWLYCGPDGTAYVDSAGGVTRARFGYDAAGSGRWYALGFLRARLGDKRPTLAAARAAARACLAAVADCDPGVRAPFDVETWRG